ncbi:acyltransferase [Marinobacter salarius]|uniref:acyltransferase family protein n=1 Tax=Marinobacter salarius TaxID=1420917 RepID=UPI0022B098DF|nr:acyltransferase [Marinobacter salarius]MCZ4284557.1 acyltransferase [Marinobacter salarius]
MGPQGNRFYALDLMRFGAAFAVVLYHLTARPGGSFEALSDVTRYGYLGVPVFFMISGFVIAMSANGRTAYQFGVSRFARLYPGLWACIAITALVVYLTSGTTFDLYQVIANAALLNDYVGQPDIDGVYWTLHVELKFYACVFLLVAFGLFQRYQVWLTAWLGLTALHMATGQPWFMGWFISPSWSPFFIVGVALYHIHSFGAGRFNGSVLASALVMSCLKTYSSADGFMASVQPLEALAAVAVVLGFAFVLALIATGRLSIKGSNTVFLAGALTYPIYLLHNRAGKAVVDASAGYIPEWLAISLTIALVIVAAYAVHRWVERPASKAIKRLAEWMPRTLVRPEQVTLAKQRD